MKLLRLLFISFVILTGVGEAQWEQTSCPGASSFLVSGTNIFAAGIGVYLSTNHGITWTTVNTGLTNTNVFSLALSGTNLYAGTGGGVFLSTNNGTNWANAGLSNFPIYLLTANGENIFASSSLSNGIFHSSNNGTSWTLVNSGLSTLYPVTALTASNSYVFAGTDGEGVFRSSDNGSTWTIVNAGLGDWGVMSLMINGTDIFAGCFWGSVSRSTNNGNDWAVVSNGLYQTGEIFALAASGSNIFAGTSFKGVYISTNNGASWTANNLGFPIFPFPNNVDIRSLIADDMYLYAGTTLYGVWRRPLNEIIPVELISFSAFLDNGIIELNWITSTETNNKGFEIERSKEGSFETIGFVNGHGTTTGNQAYSYLDKNVTEGEYKYRLKQIDFDGTFDYSDVIKVDVSSPPIFSLEQNYPNPFNPSTKIKYSIPGSEFVTLKVYDVLGNEVATLVNEEKPEGNFEITWRAEGISSGVYFYTLQAGNFVETRKILLMR